MLGRTGDVTDKAAGAYWDRNLWPSSRRHCPQQSTIVDPLSLVRAETDEVACGRVRGGRRWKCVLFVESGMLVSTLDNTTASESMICHSHSPWPVDGLI